MSKSSFGLLLIVIVLSGCASARKTYTSDGKQGYSIDCSGNASTWGKCYERAGDTCGNKGYVVLEKMGETLTSSSSSIIEQHSGTDINRTMIIRCKE
ncbi:MAG: hypothetical protein PHI31_06660 [Desulfuromonadaceae bacterium]|nr:hypothetical protein [Desulfuromonadaceae bacterium]